MPEDEGTIDMMKQQRECNTATSSFLFVELFAQPPSTQIRTAWKPRKCSSGSASTHH
ncbi:hypothetical protein DEO72_LG3g1056 [Vigna unguiculata]|uniref:Uncharacterized protein n=1 Tax=Vigna unguiculata TaxID=3917 RepID=A0A4D6LDG3_VIGUN|nr:hypothetical protein DEO72_LG3g1056 [Vigna unguiculata]